MAAINKANIQKAYYYLQRNGLRSTCYAVAERLSQKKEPPYVFVPPTKEELDRQRSLSEEMRHSEKGDTNVSIVVPLYHTDPFYLREMIDSVRAQSYPFWELVLADATEDDSVRSVVMQYENVWEEKDGADRPREKEEASLEKPSPEKPSGTFCEGRIRYISLPVNGGIAENTNAALCYATGNYIGLLDHDDVLTGDALFEVAQHIKIGAGCGINVRILYSDEDKCNGDESLFYEPNRKEKFNLDLILSNNYICHFMAMQSGLLKELGLRAEYDGAQDYDLILRALEKLAVLQNPDIENQIVHIPKVLYHWRCHPESTAQNPKSKEYAYEAGLRALQDFADRSGIGGRAVALKHLGFYRLTYQGALFQERKDVGAVGGRILRHGRIVGGRMDEKGRVFYEGLPTLYSGYLHRAALTQDAECVDIRRIALRKELWELFRQVVGVDYRCLPDGKWFDSSVLPEDADYKALSQKLCKAVRGQGYRILWMPPAERKK